MNKDREHWKNMLPIIQAFVDGEKIECYNVVQTHFHFLNSPYDYKIIRTKTINGFEVPLPAQEKPEVDTKYYLADITTDNYYDWYHWNDDDFDNLLLNRGLVFYSAEPAVMTTKAMLGIDPEGDELTRKQ